MNRSRNLRSLAALGVATAALAASGMVAQAAPAARSTIATPTAPTAPDATTDAYRSGFHLATTAPDIVPNLVLDSVDPLVAWPGDTLTLTATITNEMDVPIAEPSLEIWINWRQVPDRDALGNWVYAAPFVSEAVHGQATLDPLEPGESVEAVVTLNIDELGLAQSPGGARELALTLRDGADSNRNQVLAQVRTFMLWDPSAGADTESPRVALSLLAPVTGPPVEWQEVGSDTSSIVPQMRPSDAYFEQLRTMVSPGSSLGQIRAALEATSTLNNDESPLTLAVDPALMAVALHAPDHFSGETAASLVEWSARLLELSNASPFYRLPAYDPDLAALSRAGLTEYSLADILHTPLWPQWDVPLEWGPILAWPGGAPIPDLATLSAAREAGLTAAVISAGLTATGPTVSSLADIEVNGGEMTGLVADATLSELLHRGTEMTGPTPLSLPRAELVQRVLAETAVIAAEEQETTPHLLVVFPRDWTPEPDYLLAPLRALDDAPWVELAPFGDLLQAEVPDVSRTRLPALVPQFGELDPTQIARLIQARSGLDVMSTVTEDPAELREVVTPQLTSAMSVAWRDNPVSRELAVEGALESAEALANGLTVAVNPDVMMISAEGSLPVTVRNALPVDATVRVILEPSDSRLLITENPTVTVAAGAEARVTVPVQALASGDVTITARLVTVYDEQLAQDVSMQLRVRAGWETVGTFVFAGLLILAFVAGIIRTIRRGRSPRRTSDEALDEPIIAAEANRGGYVTGQIPVVAAPSPQDAHPLTEPLALVPLEPTDPESSVAEDSSNHLEPTGLSPKATSDENLLRGSVLMSLGTLASRLTGQVRALLLVAVIGTIGTVANAFDIGNRMPNILFALLSAGVLQAVLIPQLLRSMSAANSQERIDKLLTVAGVAMAALTALVAALMPWIVRLMTVAGDWSGPNLELAIAFALWCVPQLFFYGLFALLGQVLNARGYFGAFGWAPVANNVVSIIGFGIFLALWGSAPALGIEDVSSWTFAQTALLGGTATLGVATQALLLIWPLRRIGFTWRMRFGVRGIGLRSAGKVVGWTIGAVLLDQIGIFFLTNVTSAAGQLATDCVDAAAGDAAALALCPVVAGNATYSNALLIYFLPHSLVVVSIVTTLFPRMTAAAQAGDLDGVRRDLSSGLRNAGLFSVISAAFLFTLARPITKALFPTASQEMVTVGAPVLRAMSLGLVALGMTIMVKRMYFAFEDGKGIFWIQVLATAVLVGTLWLAWQTLNFEYWAIAAGAAYALGTWVSVLLRVRGMSRKLNGMDGARVTRLYVRAALAAVVAALAAWALAIPLGINAEYLGWTRALLITVACGAVMALVYAGGLKLLRVREFDVLLAPLLRHLPFLGRK